MFFTKVAYASVDSFVGKLDSYIVNPLIKLLFAVAIVYFLFGVFQFLANQENEEKKTEGKSHMLWGIVGLTIMMGVWAIMNLILNTLNIRGIDPEKGEVKLNDYRPPSGSTLRSN